MELTKQQTLILFAADAKVKAFKNKYKFCTKYKWWCLHCKAVIYVSYKQYHKNVIFCSDCHYEYCKKPTIVQYHYIRVLKENQIKLMESLNSQNLSKIILEDL